MADETPPPCEPRRGYVVASLDAKYGRYRGFARGNRADFSNGRWTGPCPDASWNEVFDERFGSGLVPDEETALDLLRQFRSEGCKSELLYVCTPPADSPVGLLIGYEVSELQSFTSVFNPVAWFLQPHGPLLHDRLNDFGIAPDLSIAEEARRFADTESPDHWGPWVIWAVYLLPV